jgi:hypothetical protein
MATTMTAAKTINSQRPHTQQPATALYIGTTRWWSHKHFESERGECFVKVSQLIFIIANALISYQAMLKYFVVIIT